MDIDDIEHDVENQDEYFRTESWKKDSSSNFSQQVQSGGYF